MVYRSSFVVSIPENFIKNRFLDIKDYTTFFNEYKNNKKELNKLKSQNTNFEIVQYENRELKELINDYVLSSDKILAKIIVDRDSPFLKSIIINKGSKDNIKIGTNIFDQNYLVGRVIEVNYKTARVLLLSDLNSNVPVTISPQNIQAIITGNGKSQGQIKYIKEGVLDQFSKQGIIYTSGTGAIFKSGIPVGELEIIEDSNSVKYNVEFYSDFSQLKYVFADVGAKSVLENLTSGENENQKESIEPMEAKLKILENEIKIFEEVNTKLKEENDYLKTNINNLNDQISTQKKEISSHKETINKTNINKQELEFLRLNLDHGHKCRRSFFNSKGFSVGSDKYKNCVLNKGRKTDG